MVLFLSAHIYENASFEGVSMKLIISDDGQAVSEYGLLLALVAAVAITTLLAMQDSLLVLMNNVSDGVTTSTTT